MQILASAALLGGRTFMAAHGAAVAHMLGACIGALNERGTLLVLPQLPFARVATCKLVASGLTPMRPHFDRAGRLLVLPQQRLHASHHAVGVQAC